jgi:hypothetical protein
MNDADIREVFLANGFTIKPGCDDLKPYVYAAARALLAKRPVEKTAPVQGWPQGIPWSLHLEAYAVYCKLYGAQPALIDLEGRGCRGGFGTRELDEFIPGWRDRVSEIALLRIQVKQADQRGDEALRRAHAAEAQLEALKVASMTLTVAELRDALEACGSGDDEAETEVVLTRRIVAIMSDENEPMPPGLYLHFDEYPEEGVIGPLGKPVAAAGEQP